MATSGNSTRTTNAANPAKLKIRSQYQFRRMNTVIRRRTLSLRVNLAANRTDSTPKLFIQLCTSVEFPSPPASCRTLPSKPPPAETASDFFGE